MSLTARQVMDPHYYTLSPQATMGEAAQLFLKASRERGRPVFGLVVIDEAGKVVGLVSVYDLLLLLRPKHIHIWGELQDIDFSGVLEQACRGARKVLVGEVMTTQVITITPDTSLLMIIDIMIKKHVRRLPVVENGKTLGMVYLSDVFDRLAGMLADKERS